MSLFFWSKPVSQPFEVQMPAIRAKIHSVSRWLICFVLIAILGLGAARLMSSLKPGKDFTGGKSGRQITWVDSCSKQIGTDRAKSYNRSSSDSMISSDTDSPISCCRCWRWRVHFWWARASGCAKIHVTLGSGCFQVLAPWTHGRQVLQALPTSLFPPFSDSSQCLVIWWLFFLLFAGIMREY